MDPRSNEVGAKIASPGLCFGFFLPHDGGSSQICDFKQNQFDCVRGLLVFGHVVIFYLR